MGPRLLLADDHVLLLDVLQPVLSARYEVIAAVHDGRALLEACRALKPDVIITDITMPLLNGLDAIRQLKRLMSLPKVVFLTMHHDFELVRECFRFGGSAFVAKERSCEDLLAAIAAVLRNHRYVSPEFLSVLSELTPDSDCANERSDPLTSRQREILQLFAEGKSVKEIAVALNLSTRTVEWHKYRTMEVLHAANGAELIRYAIKIRLVS